MSTKKEGRGRPRVDSERVDVRLPRDMLDALDRFIAESHPSIKRPEAVRIALREWMKNRKWNLADSEGQIS